MSELAFVTVATHDFAPQSLILARSIRRFHPDAVLILFAVENDAHAELYGDAFDEIITCPDIGVSTLADMAFRYSQSELCFALKPWTLLHLLRCKKYDVIVYVDSDIELFSPLKEAVKAVANGANLVLTPHITAPAREKDHVTENGLLKSGACNAGFLAVSTREPAEHFLAWWASKTQADAGHDPMRGTYGDQKWLDLAPSLLDKVTILRHPGYNVAYWNCHLRAMGAASKGWMCNGQPLRFFHYSRWNMTVQSADDYFREFFAPGCSFILPVLQSYAERVAAEAPTPADACSGLATFHLPDGQTIPAIVKSAYMRNVSSISASRDRVVEISLEALKAPSKQWPRHGGQAITVLHDWIWRSQPEEWRCRHDLSTAAGWHKFRTWLCGEDAAHYAIPSAYLGLFESADIAAKLSADEPAEAARRDNQMLLARVLDLQVQLDKARQAALSPVHVSAPLPVTDRRSSIWTKGLAFLRGLKKDDPESDDVAIFWEADTVFRNFFGKLDHADILQFGCGNGRHAARLLEHYRPRRLILVDGSQIELDACRARFAGRGNITYVLDAAGGLDMLEDGSRSAVFSYDHLVRIEYDDVAACLARIGRMLAPGKYALLHHSSNDGQPGVAAADSRRGRSFMSAALFNHICARAGLFVVENARVGEFDELSLAQRISPLS